MRNNISRLQNFMEQGNSYYVGKNFEKILISMIGYYK